MKTESSHHLQHRVRTAPYASTKVPEGLERGTLAGIRVKKTTPQLRACILKTTAQYTGFTRNQGFCTTAISCDRALNETITSPDRMENPRTIPSSGSGYGYSHSNFENDTVPCLIYPPDGTPGAHQTGFTSAAKFISGSEHLVRGYPDYFIPKPLNNTEVFGCTAFDLVGNPQSWGQAPTGTQISFINPVICDEGRSNKTIANSIARNIFGTPAQLPTPTPSPINSPSSSITLGGALTTAAAGVLSTAAAFVSPTPTATIAASAPLWTVSNTAIVVGGGGALIGLGGVTLGAVALYRNLRKKPEPFTPYDVRHTLKTTTFKRPTAEVATEPEVIPEEEDIISALPTIPEHIRTRNDNSCSSDRSNQSVPSDDSSTGLLGRSPLRANSLPPPPGFKPPPPPVKTVSEENPTYDRPRIRTSSTVSDKAASAPSPYANMTEAEQAHFDQMARDFRQRKQAAQYQAPYLALNRQSHVGAIQTVAEVVPEVINDGQSQATAL